jgi:hypothetical protein
MNHVSDFLPTLPQLAYETISEGWRERLAICLADGIPEEEAIETANKQRLRAEVAAMMKMQYPDRSTYLDLVAMTRGRLDMRILRIALMNA